MKYTIVLFALISIFDFTEYHRDRLEEPISYEFVLKNKKIIRLAKKDQNLEKISDQIAYQKIEIENATIAFKTGEKVHLKRNGKIWTSIKIVFRKREKTIASETLSKLSEINFSSVRLLWSGENETAFESDYFYLQFDMGTKRVFNKLPYVQLFFDEDPKPIIWTPVSENSIQWKKL